MMALQENNPVTCLYDGTYGGLLTVVFESFERKLFPVRVMEKNNASFGLFDEPLDISTDHTKAERVLNGLKKKLHSNIVSRFYKVFLSEDNHAINAVLNIMQQLFLGNEQVLMNYMDENVLLFDKTLISVDRERHRMKAFIRFQKSSEGMYYALIEPDFNVLPLILKFFRQRYTDQQWLIYDVKRNYGMLYDRKQISEVHLSVAEKQSLLIPAAEITLDDRENHFQNLWKQYFKSTNIEARKNLKLHLQHVPKRYWKYLVEKNG